jgi:hypothetical protein
MVRVMGEGSARCQAVCGAACIPTVQSPSAERGGSVHVLETAASSFAQPAWCASTSGARRECGAHSRSRAVRGRCWCVKTPFVAVV